MITLEALTEGSTCTACRERAGAGLGADVGNGEHEVPHDLPPIDFNEGMQKVDS